MSMDAEKIDNHGMLRQATSGNRHGVGMAYRHAAAWLKDGEAPPADLCEWLAERLEALGRVLCNNRESKPVEAAFKAIGAGDSKRGNKGKADQEDRASFLAWDVYYQKRNPGRRMTNPEIFEVVAKRCSLGSRQLSASVVEAAWKRRKEFGI